MGEFLICALRSHARCVWCEAIAKMSEWRRKGVRRIDLKIIASDPDPVAVTKAVEALN
jgi:hypothetical protein